MAVVEADSSIPERELEQEQCPGKKNQPQQPSRVAEVVFDERQEQQQERAEDRKVPLEHRSNTLLSTVISVFKFPPTATPRLPSVIILF